MLKINKKADHIDDDERAEIELPEIVLSNKEKKAFGKKSENLHLFHKEVNRTLTMQFCIVMLAAFIAALALRAFIIEPTKVQGTSMETTLINGERLAVEKISYLFNEPQRGDIVIVHYPRSRDRYVKRVIALAGETVSIEDGYVYINGKRLDETAYAGDWYGNIVQRSDYYSSYTVPEGCVFVMGDNRNDSTDSRSIKVGAIPLEQVLGRAMFVVWPVKSIRGIVK